MLSADFLVPESPSSGFGLIFHQFENGNMVMTHHNISYSGDRPVIDTTRAFTQADLAQLVEILQDTSAQTSSLLPENILANSPSRLVWYKKPEVRLMWFKTGSAPAKSIRVPWPGLILKATAGRLDLAAYKGKRRPSATTQLYHAPLMNVYAKCNLCFGSATVPSDLSVSSIPAWESAVFDSIFTHHNHSQTMKIKGKDQASNGEHWRYWRNLGSAYQQDNNTQFDNRILVSLKQKLEKWV